MSKVDIPVIEKKSEKRYVTVPEFDLFDMQHPIIHVNHFAFGPGTHYLDKELADTVEDRLRAYARANIRILQPRRDTDAENLLSRGRQGSAAGMGAPTTDF